MVPVRHFPPPPAPGPRPGLSAGVGRAPEPSRASTPPSVRVRQGPPTGAARAGLGGAGAPRGPQRGLRVASGPAGVAAPRPGQGSQPPGPDPSGSRFSVRDLKTSGFCQFPAGSLLKSSLGEGSGLALTPFSAGSVSPVSGHRAVLPVPPGQKELPALTGASPRPPTLSSRYLPAAQPRESGIAAPPSRLPLRNRPRWFLFLPQPSGAAPSLATVPVPCWAFASRGWDPDRSHPDLAGFPKSGRWRGTGSRDALTPRPEAASPAGARPEPFLRHKGAHCAASKSLIPRRCCAWPRKGGGGLRGSVSHRELDSGCAHSSRE